MRLMELAAIILFNPSSPNHDSFLSADDTFFFFVVENKAWYFIWIICWQMIHMKEQALFGFIKIF